MTIWYGSDLCRRFGFAHLKSAARAGPILAASVNGGVKTPFGIAPQWGGNGRICSPLVGVPTHHGFHIHSVSAKVEELRMNGLVRQAPHPRKPRGSILFSGAKGEVEPIAFGRRQFNLISRKNVRSFQSRFSRVEIIEIHNACAGERKRA